LTPQEMQAMQQEMQAILEEMQLGSGAVASREATLIGD